MNLQAGKKKKKKVVRESLGQKKTTLTQKQIPLKYLVAKNKIKKIKKKAKTKIQMKKVRKILDMKKKRTTQKKPHLIRRAAMNLQVRTLRMLTKLTSLKKAIKKWMMMIKNLRKIK